MHLIRTSALVCLMSTAAIPAFAQTSPSPANNIGAPSPYQLDLPAPAPEAAPAPRGPTAPFAYERTLPTAGDPEIETAAVTTVDESALRYWASQEDVARVSAEIRRLKAIHPNWEPPIDLFAPTRQFEDEKPLWALYSQGDFVGLRQAVADIRGKRPDWQPSADLAKKIVQGEARQELIIASDSGDSETVLTIAAANNDMLVCSQIDVLWRVAEALAQSGDTERAMHAYRYILSSCSNPQERLSTVQKAGVVLGPDALTTLMPLGRRGANGRHEFEQVRLDLMRAKIGAAMGASAVAGPPDADIKTFEKTVIQTRSSGDAQLLGWYAYNAKEFQKAYDWFKLAQDWKPDPKSIEGLALSLREMGKREEAEELAFANADDPLVRKIFIELVSSEITGDTPHPLSEARQIRFAAVVDAARSSLGAQSLGWSLYSQEQIENSYEWFKKSVAWGENEEGVIGLIVTSKRLKKEAEYKELMAGFGGRYDRVGELSKSLNYSVGGGGGGGLSATARLAIDQYEKKDYKAAAATLKGLRNADRGLRVMQAWAQYNAGDWDGAKESFTDLHEARPTADAAQGLRVIKMRQMPPQFRNRQ